ncbi:MAG: MFS transporter [Chloroflexi bacterium]|nr:MFS transporter [Chloroflexota bacterium]
MILVFVASLLGHFSVDILNGTRSVLFTYLSVPLQLSNTELGLFNTAYIFTTSLMQPFFGFLTDKYGSRISIVGGLLWMGVFFSIGLMTPGFAGLIFLIIASIGSGAFHPAGTMQATLIGKKLFKGRETLSASIFFLFGQIGHFIGPLAAGLLLNKQGAQGLLYLVVFILPIALLSGKVLKPTNTDDKSAGELKEEKKAKVVKQLSGVLDMFALLAAFQAWTQANMVTYLPKYFSDMGKTPAQYGFLTSLFMGGSAIGNVLGGMAADRFGKRKVAGIALGLAVLPISIIAAIGWSNWLYLLIPLTGVLTGSTHSIIIVLAQKIIPSGMAFASGLILGFMFASGALGALLSGYFADLWGFPTMFAFTAGIALIAALLTASLQKVKV